MGWIGSILAGLLKGLGLFSWLGQLFRDRRIRREEHEKVEKKALERALEAERYKAKSRVHDPDLDPTFKLRDD